MTKTIEVIVSPAGETKIETRGYQGSGCRDATRLLEAALGQVVHERSKPEIYQSEIQAQSIRQDGAT